MLHSRCEVLQGDVTKMEVDAIVNAANTSLLGGGGVDGAIHRAGGKAILEECVAIHNSQGGCKTGEAVITTAGNLPCKYVIHAVGPVWNGGNNAEESLLSDAYSNSLKLAQSHRIQTKMIKAFPIIVFCKEFHRELMDYVEKLIVAGTISPVDLDLVLLTDSIEEAVEHIKTNSIDQFGLKYAEPKPSKWLFEKKFF